MRSRVVRYSCTLNGEVFRAIGRIVGTLLVLGAVIVISSGIALAEEEVNPVYVGARVCAPCHDGPKMGHQFSKWLLSKHAQAYASLAKPESRMIARLSGIPQEPQQAPMCLGCHATASDVEEWELDHTFRMEDGVQCEQCHGPGSEYIAGEVMENPEAAREAGLRMPEKRDCLVCHREKGSHVALLGKHEWDVETAWKDLQHPTPEGLSRQTAEIYERVSGEKTSRSAYVGSSVCGKCHKGPEMGYQFSRWRMSTHALAFARLGTSKAREIAKESGVSGNPQESDACLKCHETGGRGYRDAEVGDLWLGEGVGCEACHAPGEKCEFEGAGFEPASARTEGLSPADEENCRRCHDQAHGKSFNYEKAVAEIAHPTKLPEAEKELQYKTPVNLALSPDARELYVACEASNSVIVIDTGREEKAAEIEVGGQPHDIAFSPDGHRAYVSNRLDDTVSVIDVRARKVVQTFGVGDEPHGLLTDPKGRRLFVLNTAEDSISVIDTTDFSEITRLAASRNPWSLALSPDGTRLLVSNTLSRFVPFRTPLMSEVTVVDLGRAVVKDRLVVPAANLLQGVAWHPKGDFALVTLLRTKNLVPMTRLLQGWTITNGLGVLWADGRVDQVLLDQPDIAFPDPADVAFTPDGRLALVTSSGSDRVAVVDLSKLLTMLREASPREREEVLPNHLGKPTEFVIGHMVTGNSPRGIVAAPDSRTAYVANALDDSLSVLDLETLATVKRIDLGGPKEITKVRLGEQVFHSAQIAFHRQFSCHTCHPDGHIDGVTYDIEPDGVGVSPVDNRTLRGILDTAPFKWEGTNPTLQRQCGPRLAVFFTRIDPFSPEELTALDLYISTIPRPPNRYRPLGAELTEAQRSGKKLFNRTKTNDGRLIPVEARCSTCHPPPLYTDRQRHDIETKMEYDREGRFDTPHLNNIYDSAPYLHNGIAETLEEIWTRYNPNDKHGVTNDMTKDQLNDLIEFLKTL